MAKTTVLTSRQWVVLKHFLDLKWGQLISTILGFAPQRWIKRSQVCLATMWILSFLPYTKIFKKTLIKKGQEWTFDIFFYGRKGKRDEWVQYLQHMFSNFFQFESIRTCSDQHLLSAPIRGHRLYQIPLYKFATGKVLILISKLYQEGFFDKSGEDFLITWVSYLQESLATQNQCFLLK